MAIVAHLQRFRDDRVEIDATRLCDGRAQHRLEDLDLPAYLVDSPLSVASETQIGLKGAIGEVSVRLVLDHPDGHAGAYHPGHGSDRVPMMVRDKFDRAPGDQAFRLFGSAGDPLQEHCTDDGSLLRTALLFPRNRGSG